VRQPMYGSRGGGPENHKSELKGWEKESSAFCLQNLFVERKIGKLRRSVKGLMRGPYKREIGGLAKTTKSK